MEQCENILQGIIITIVNKLKKIYKKDPTGLNGLVLYKYDLLDLMNEEREIEVEGRGMKCDGENGQVLAKFKTIFEKDKSPTDGEGIIEINVKPGLTKPYVEIAWLPKKAPWGVMNFP